MQNYNLTTWSGDRLVGYEPIVAASAGEAVAFAQGLLTERTRGETHFLVKMGVRYVVDHGHRAQPILGTLRRTCGRDGPLSGVVRGVLRRPLKRER